MQEKKVTVKHWVEYLLFSMLVMLVRVSPLFLLGLNRALFRFLLRRGSKRHVAYMRKNLAIAFPAWSDEQIGMHMEKVFQHFAEVFVDIIYLFIKRKPGKTLKPIETINLEALEKAVKKGKGVILFSAHFGNWELVPYILSRELDIKINSIAREMDNPLIERKVLEFREYMGSEIIYKKNSVRTLLKRIEEKGIVYLLIDQNTIEREAVFVDFFGKKASAVPSVSRLHIRKGIPVVPLFIHYEPRKIVLELMDELRFQGGSGNRDGDILRLTQECTTLIEQKIREYPEQWFWFHDRWRTQPCGRVDETPCTTGEKSIPETASRFERNISKAQMQKENEALA